MGALSEQEAGIIKGVASVLHDEIEPLKAQIAALSARVLELERGQKTYLGVWKEGREYTPQSEVTCDGARWICHKRTSDKPGTSADWSLMEKSAGAGFAPPARERSDTTVTAHARNGPSHSSSNPRLR